MKRGKDKKLTQRGNEIEKNRDEEEDEEEKSIERGEL